MDRELFNWGFGIQDWKKIGCDGALVVYDYELFYFCMIFREEMKKAGILKSSKNSNK
jgi:hypothetical protein